MSKRNRSEAAKLGWARRRKRAAHKAAFEASIPAARARVEAMRREGQDAHLIGNLPTVIDERVPAGTYYVLQGF